MTEETSARIWHRWELLMQESCGSQPYSESVSEILLLLAMLTQAFHALGTKEQAMLFFARFEEPSEEELERLAGVARFAMPVIHDLARRTAQKSLEVLPKPTGGRPDSCTAQEKEDICTEILRLIGTGLSAAEAKRRSGRERKVHPKTIDRIWADRSKYASQKMTYAQAQGTIQTLMQSIWSKVTS